MEDSIPVRRVPVDGVFSIDGLRYTMLKQSPGSAYVQLPNGDKSTISNGALCTVIDTELEDMLGTPMAVTTKKAKKADAPAAVGTSGPKGSPGPQGAAVPKPKRGGGKPALAGKRPANPETKRGKVLALLLKTSSVAAAEKAFGMARSAVLTYCFEIHRDHGWGYVIDGDKVNYTLPPDRKDMFAAAPASSTPAAATPAPAPSKKLVKLQNGSRKARSADPEIDDML